VTALIVVAIVAGVAVALQGQCMAVMDRTAGTAASVFITYGVGALLALALWLTHRPAPGALRRIPWYAWTAGVLGLVIVGGIGYAAPRLGLARTLVITVAAQLAAALIIEQRFDLSRLAGCALTVAGVWLVVRS
jgi:transporter family-2 protein